MRTSFYKGFEARFYVEGHQLVIPLQHTNQKKFRGFAKQGFDFTMFLHQCLVLFKRDAQELAVGNGFEEVGRWRLSEKGLWNSRK